MSACPDCLRRTWLVARLAPHVELARTERRRLGELLALSDQDLVAAVAGRDRARVRAEYAMFSAAGAKAAASRARLATLCRHDERYPPRLAEAGDAPAVLHVAGDPARLTALAAEPGAPAVAVVGARRATDDGLQVARTLGRGLAAAGVTVVSGMALGIDSAAHAGALEGGPTLAVLAGGADVPYPRSKQRLYDSIVAGHAAISEMPPGMRPFRWCFPARNRTIAGLADVTVVVEAAERSGSLITAELAQDLGRTVGAVPGRVTSVRSAGSNALLRDGAHVIRGAQDALDEVLGIGVMTVPARRDGHELSPRLRAVLDGVDDGRDDVEALCATPVEAERVMADLAELELLGYLRRGPGGRYARVL